MELPYCDAIKKRGALINVDSFLRIGRWIDLCCPETRQHHKNSAVVIRLSNVIQKTGEFSLTRIKIFMA